MNKKKLEQKMAKVADKLQLKTLELRIDNDFTNIYIQYPVKLNLTSPILQETFETIVTSSMSFFMSFCSMVLCTSLSLTISQNIHKHKFIANGNIRITNILHSSIRIVRCS